MDLGELTGLKNPCFEWNKRIAYRDKKHSLSAIYYMS